MKTKKENHEPSETAAQHQRRITDVLLDLYALEVTHRRLLGRLDAHVADEKLADCLAVTTEHGQSVRVALAGRKAPVRTMVAGLLGSLRGRPRPLQGSSPMQTISACLALQQVKLALYRTLAKTAAVTDDQGTQALCRVAVKQEEQACAWAAEELQRLIDKHTGREPYSAVRAPLRWLRPTPW